MPTVEGKPDAGSANARLAVAIVLGVLVLDQATKVWAVEDLSDGPVSIIGNDVQFELSRNSGAAFSLFRGFTPLLAILAIVFAFILVRAVRRADDRLSVVALALVFGGALGNLIDRAVRAPSFLSGHVVDFVKVGSFPTFNVADSAITIGAVLLVISLFLPRRRAGVVNEFAEPLVVPASLEGERVDRAIAFLTGWSRSDVQALVAAGDVLVGGRAVARSHRLLAGEVVEVLGAPPVDEVPGPEPVPVEVRYEDADVIVVNKPPGLVVHPGAGHAHGTLVHGLLARFPELSEVGDPARPGIVHRLDRDTSGLLVVARTPHAYRTLVDALTRRDVDRSYLALVWGEPESPRGVVDAPIGRSTRRRTRMAVRETGRPARTAYEVVRTFDDPGVSLVECRLETGRTHQIRVHLAAIGHPVVGDGAYGGSRAQMVLGRPFLHTAGLEFRHPSTGESMRFAEPLPADLEAALAALEGSA